MCEQAGKGQIEREKENLKWPPHTAWAGPHDQEIMTSPTIRRRTLNRLSHLYALCD